MSTFSAPCTAGSFEGDGCAAAPGQRGIRGYTVAEDRGLAFAWFDHAGAEPAWEPPALFDDDQFPRVLWHHSRLLELHHPSVPMDNSVDPRHFQHTHSMFGKCLEDGTFEPSGHRAVGRMATEITPPLSYASGDRAEVYTEFHGPLNTYLRATSGGRDSHLCNLLTIIEGKHCRLTQIGVGRRSRNPLRWLEDGVGFLGSWYATYEDAAVWNNRKVLEPDNDAHQTDRTLAEFREWFDGFLFDPEDSRVQLSLVGEP